MRSAGLLRQQPRRVARLNLRNPLTQGLVFACYPIGHSFYDAVSKQVAGHPGTLRPRPCADGNHAGSVSAIGITTAGGKFTNPTGLDALSGAHSIFVEAGLEVNASTQNVLSSYETLAGNGFKVQMDDTSYATNCFAYLANNAVVTTNSNFDSLGTGVEAFTKRVMVTVDGTNNRFYCQRGLDRTVANTIFPVADSTRRTTVVGDPNAQSAGSLAFGYGWNRVLSLAEFQSLYDNPAQIWEDDIERIFQTFVTPPVGGGAVSTVMCGGGL